jgi:hypothetical protein
MPAPVPPVLQNLDYNLQECQALVLAPTRELAQQIEKVMRALGDYLQVKCHACVGGTSVREDTRILQVRRWGGGARDREAGRRLRDGLRLREAEVVECVQGRNVPGTRGPGRQAEGQRD